MCHVNVIHIIILCMVLYILCSILLFLIVWLCIDINSDYNL